MFLIHGIGDLVTLAPVASKRQLTGYTDADLGRLRDAWLVTDSGRVKEYGSGPVPERYRSLPDYDAKGGLVMPGLVDCHTHPVFAGSRAHEFCQRLGGATYQDIAKAGGGIRYTVEQTRKASREDLTSVALERVRRFLSHGVTTLEAKSGYGLSVKDEMKLLEAMADVRTKTPQHIEATCLALHAVPKDALSKEAFIHDMTHNLLPAVAKAKLAGWADAFVEEGYFSVEDARPYFEKAKELGFKIRLHADEFTDSKAGAAAAAWGARSADHCEHTPPEAMRAMAEKGVVAVLLPGTSLYSKLPYTNARTFREHGVPIALATDFNPGSCVVENLAFTATLGALHCGLDLPHTVAAVTYVAACSLDLGARKGALAVGHDADIVVYDYRSIEEWLAGLGQMMPRQVFMAGRTIS